MSHRSRNSIAPKSVALGTLLTSLLSCTQAARTGVESTSRPSFSAAGSLFSTISNSARGRIETQTVSLALDRIDQHDLPLDRTYRHSGTGRGITVYVFDGGVLANHP